MLATRTARVRLLTVLGALVVAAWMTSSASAAQRYATPSGAGDCSSASPCGIAQAVSGASDGDEVIVTPGDYSLRPQGLNVYNAVTIHGVAGQPRPRLLVGGSTPSVLLGAGSTLRYVEVDQAPGVQGTTLGASGALVDQVIANGTAQPGWPTVLSANSTIRNSIVVAPGVNGVALRTESNGAFASGTYRNVTAIATESGGYAIEARANTPGSYASILARNVIARGGPPAAGHSLVAHTDSSPGATAKITVDHSNWLDASPFGSNASIVEGGGNQHSAPVFVGAAGGDYHQAAGSPTIGAGLDEFIDGPLDVDGDPRQLFGIDIGADEFVDAPAATTGPATAVTDHSATLGGSFDAKGAPTSYHFEYGPTTAYGSVTATTSGGSGGATAAAATLGGLSPSTDYHYRLVATNAGGTATGTDRDFTTTTPPATAPPSTSTSSTAATSTTPAFAGVRLVSARLAFARGFTTVTLSCPTGTMGRCLGTTRLTARGRPTRSRPGSTVTLGRASFSIVPGKQSTMRVRVSRAGRRLLSAAPRVKGEDINVARDEAGRSRTTVAAVTIRRHHS